MRRPAIASSAAVTAEWRANVEFAVVGNVSLTLDAHIPDGAVPFPAVISLHGGGFTAGDKQTYGKPLRSPVVVLSG